MLFFLFQGGATSIRGNAITFAQDISELAKVLPRLPDSLPYVYLQKSSDKKPNPIKLKIRPDVTFQALRELKETSSVYADVEISEENMKFYYDCNGEFSPTNILEEDWEEGINEEEATGPMTEDDIVITEDDYDFDAPNPFGLVPQNVNTKTAKAMMKEAILPDKPQGPVGHDNMFQPKPSGDASSQEGGEINNDPGVDETEKAEEEDEFVTIPWPAMSKKPVKEREPGYFQRIFPELFPSFHGDFKVFGETRLRNTDNFKVSVIFLNPKDLLIYVLLFLVDLIKFAF